MNEQQSHSILEHELSKTKETFTHISNTKFNDINNPFDDMDI